MTARLRIVPFADEHLDAAAALLAARHARHREAEPLLPEGDPSAQLESEWGADGASGAIAFRGDDPAGYLVARPAPSGVGGTWMLAGIGGHAVEGDRELARDLYAAAAAAWVEAGQRRHMVFVPAHDRELVDAWFRLEHGASAVLAARETAPEPPVENGVVVRPGTPDDLELAARLDRALGESMVPSPSFSFAELDDVETYVDEWRDTWEDERFVHFVAEREGEVVGQAVLYRRPADLRVPPDSIDLANAATWPHVRGSGAGLALTAHVLRWASEQGIPTMVTDWRTTNLWASRFWPRRGFRPTFLRLYRAV